MDVNPHLAGLRNYFPRRGDEKLQKVDAVLLLLKNGADSNGWSYVHHSFSYLAHAASINNQVIFRLLLDHGTHARGSEALCGAAEAGNTAALKELVSLGADVDEIISSRPHADLDYVDHSRSVQLDKFIDHSRQGTPLPAAVLEEHVETVRYLLSKGANKNIQDLDRGTAEGIVSSCWMGPTETFLEARPAKKRKLEILKMLQ